MSKEEPTGQERQDIYERVFADMLELTQDWEIEKLHCATTLFSAMCFTMQLVMAHSPPEDVLNCIGLAMTRSFRDHKKREKEHEKCE